MLEDAGLRPLPKTSGGKGLQLYAPISGRTAITFSPSGTTTRQ